jgi:flagellar protein FlaJ
MNSNAFTLFCYRLLGNYASFISRNIDISDELKKANFKINHAEYLSTALFLSIATFFLSAILFAILGLAIIKVSYSFVPATLMGIFVSLVISNGVFIFLYLYPYIVISSRSTKINRKLPFATMYMSTLAGTGLPIQGIFKMLADREEYGELSKEFAKIHNEVASYGADILSAIARAANRTPSDKFKDLLWGINNLINTGGNLRNFLYEKSRNYMADYRRELDKFAQNLALLLEIYITLVIVGSVFLIVLTVIMGPIGINELLIVGLQLAGTFVLLPVASLIFILLIKTISPVG